MLDFSRNIQSDAKYCLPIFGAAGQNGGGIGDFARSLYQQRPDQMPNTHIRFCKNRKLIRRYCAINNVILL